MIEVNVSNEDLQAVIYQQAKEIAALKIQLEAMRRILVQNEAAASAKVGE